MNGEFKIHWIDRGSEPRHPPNPAYPNGVDLDLTQQGAPACTVALPYPAPRIGFFAVECQTCGKNALISTTGRADDPRSVKLACERTLQ